ncbi:MAG: hypothetical protein WA705_14020 [Candidatus Ozemobacteraceae bacterium]
MGIIQVDDLLVMDWMLIKHSEKVAFDNREQAGYIEAAKVNSDQDEELTMSHTKTLLPGHTPDQPIERKP